MSSSENRRVVVTGYGTVSAAGVGFEALWDSLMAHRTHFGPIEKVPDHAAEVALDAEVPPFDAEEHGLTRKEARRLDLFSQYAILAADEAVAQSGIDFLAEDCDRIGVVCGTGMGGLSTLVDSQTKLDAKHSQRAINPLLVPVMAPNMASANLALRYGLHGENFAITTACASSTHSIGEAMRLIRHGYEDVMLAGGTEMVVCDITLCGFADLSALSKQTDPALASLPFDARRSGFVLSEGAGILMLESLEHATERGAEILAEVVGFGSTCDAYHMTAPDPSGEGPARAMSQAIEEAGATPADLDYLNAHGTATEYNDVTESKALHLLCGDHTPDVLVHSVKGNIGHSLGAAGGIEAAVTVRCIQDGTVPGTCGFAEPDPACDVTVTADNTEREIGLALSTSLGFGGHNAALAFAPYEA